MNHRFLTLMAAAAAFWQMPVARGEVLFEDGFEDGLSRWQISTTADGRAITSGDHEPATDTRHLVMDDAASDANFSVAEASVSLDLTRRRNVVLNFKSKSLGNDPHPAPSANFSGVRNFDAVTISTDGGTTWRQVRSLANGTTSWTSHVVPLDSPTSLLGGSFGPDFRIRFSMYDNAPAPLDGIAIDDVSVTADPTQLVSLELAGTVAEGSGPYTGLVQLAMPAKAPLTLELETAPAGVVNTPATVTIPAGQTSASFEYSVNEDALVTLNRSISFKASAAGLQSLPATLTVTDNDAPVPVLTLPPELREGNTPSNNATISIGQALPVAVTFLLSANPQAELSFSPSTQVSLPAGQTQVSFTVRAYNDSTLDGSIPVTVTATTASLATATASVMILDDEMQVLSLGTSALLLEGTSASYRVSLGGTLLSPLTVTIQNSNPAALTVPQSVTAPAGSSSVNFTATAVDNAAHDGSRVAVLTATATAAGWPTATKTVTVRDNEIATYSISPGTELVEAKNPLPIGFYARDVEGNLVDGRSGSASLELLLPDGGVLSLGSVELSGYGWTGSVTLPGLDLTPLRIRLTDAKGVTATTPAFHFMRKLDLKTVDMVWDAARGRIYASIPASPSGPGANRVVAIDPATLEITGSIATGLDPGLLAITDDNSTLYVAQNANGSISKVDLTTMTVSSNFLLGVNSSGVLSAQDLCTVAGRPDMLIVARKTGDSLSPNHAGVAAYLGGVMLAKTLPASSRHEIIEASADPAVFFGYDSTSSGHRLTRLQLDAAGLTELESTSALSPSVLYASTIRSSGNRIYSSSGVEIEGVALRVAGTFGNRGLFLPDPATNRVYCLESSGFDFVAISAFDAGTRTLLKRYSFPLLQEQPTGFTRFGTDGLAFRSSKGIYLINRDDLVPTGAAADLAVTVQAGPESPAAGGPLGYTVTMTNHGPNPALAATLSAVLSAGQSLQGAVSSTGILVVAGLSVSLPPADLAAGASVTLTLDVLPAGAGGLSCTVQASSLSVDPDGANNRAIEMITAGFQAGPDTWNTLKVPAAAAMIYDPLRKLFWASIAGAGSEVPGKSLVSIDPLTGRISDPLPLPCNPIAKSIAISANGRYLYVGLADVSELARFDLQAVPPLRVQIPLDLPGDSDPRLATDIEVLDGDGTSVLIAGRKMEVIDGIVRRPGYAGSDSTRIERGATAETFVGFYPGLSSQPLARHSILPGGVVTYQQASNLLPSDSDDIAGAGAVVLSNSGYLVNSATLTVRHSLGISGRPCMDGQRAYLVNGGAVRNFNPDTGAALESLPIPTSASGDWAHSCLRWGANGIAVLGKEGTLLLNRWTVLAADPDAPADANGDGIADGWALTHFGTATPGLDDDGDHDGIGAAFEYLFGASPEAFTASPLQLSVGNAAGGGKVIHLIYPRRVGIAAGSYRIEATHDPGSWAAATGVTETVLSTQTVNGVVIETVEALVPAPAGGRGFVRLKWLRQ